MSHNKKSGIHSEDYVEGFTKGLKIGESTGRKQAQEAIIEALGLYEKFETIRSED